MSSTSKEFVRDVSLAEYYPQSRRVSGEVQRIVLLNGWHDDNKGDSAIVEGAIRTLLARWPNANIALVDILPHGHPLRESAHRHLRAAFPSLVVAPSPVPLYSSTSRFPAALRPFAFATLLLRSLVALLGLSAGTASTRLIRRADLVIANGGHYLHSSRWSPFSWFRLFRLVAPIWMASGADKPVVLLGHSLGPFDRVGAALTRFALRKSKVIAREALSVAVASRERLGAGGPYRAPDTAFGIHADRSSRVKRVLDDASLRSNGFWAVTVRQWPHASEHESEQRTTRFLVQMAVFLRQALDHGMTERIALVAHTLGPSNIEDDRHPTKRLQELVSDARVVVIDEDLTPGELVALYAEATLLIGTRFHSVIFGLLGGTPSFAISYYGPKAHGIMADLQMPDMCLDMESLNSADLLARIRDLDLPALRRSITDSVSSTKRDLGRTMDWLCPASVVSHST